MIIRKVDTSDVIHIAGIPVTVPPRLRQRCSWCGATLIDYDLDRVAVPVGQEASPGTWEIGSLVLVDGGMSAHVPHQDGDPLPPGACARIDPEATK